MNFHTKEYLQNQVIEHLNEAREYFLEENIVGIFYQGSANYGMDYENSDVDTKLIVTPTVDDLVYNKKPVSTTHVRANNEHIDFKDVRLYVETFRKQNLNFLEILFTDYFWINPLYEKNWNILIQNKEKIAHLNPYLAVKAMRGVAEEKYHALEHLYPSKIDIIEKYGYDSKQLHHLLRVQRYINDYINGKSYIECLRPDEAFCNYLTKIKADNSFYSLKEARDIAQEAINSIDRVCKYYCSETENKMNEETDMILKQVQAEIMRTAIYTEVDKI